MNCVGCDAHITEWDSDNTYNWCTGCGNYGIAAALKRALNAEHLTPQNTLLCFDIGCHGNGADKISGYVFHGLHGRVIPFASGAALANSRMKVIAESGDGGALSEGINHLVHAVRNDYNMVFILHNNANYALTTGQASATTPIGTPMNASPDGVVAPPLNVCQFILNLNPSFVARGYSADVNELTEIFQHAMNHRGFAFVEVIQDCPTYNKVMSHDWTFPRVVKPDGTQTALNSDINTAITVAQQFPEKIHTGVLYQRPENVDYINRLVQRLGKDTELVDEVELSHPVAELLAAFR
jgi:2-oxoglutarate/2-oxoacid ferredoxin oxidoreductase subunit beta